MQSMGSWTTVDEIKVIQLMASDKPRGKYSTVPTKLGRIARLQTWLKYAGIRRWPLSVNVGQCIFAAQKELGLLCCDTEIRK